MDPTEKDAAYETLRVQLASVLEDCPDFVGAMASAAAMLNDTFEHFFWTGFYLPQEDGSLRVGPYQGPLACTLLPAGKGVCAAAASRRESVVVADVYEFPGHIACDPRSRSEIVVPLIANERLIAVLDVDSERPGAFDEVDRRHLEAVAALLAARR